MLSVNKVTLIGNLTRDPEIKDTSGGKLARFAVATSRRYRDRDGAMQDSTQFHDVVVFNDRLVDLVDSYCVKGTQVMIEGSLEHRSYDDKDGNKRYVSEVVIRAYGGDIQLGNRPQGQGDEDRGSDRGGERSGGAQRGGGADRERDGGRGRDDRNDRNDRGGSRSGGGNSNRGGYDDDLDDDIPF